MKFANQDMAEAKTSLAESAEAKATAEGDLGVTSKDLAADEKTLADLHQDCMEKSETFEEEVKSRGEELKAIDTAKKVILEHTGAAESITYGASSLFQASSQISSGADLANFEAVSFVRNLARKEKSPMLEQLAS